MWQLPNPAFSGTALLLQTRPTPIMSPHSTAVSGRSGLADPFENPNEPVEGAATHPRIRPSRISVRPSAVSGAVSLSLQCLDPAGLSD